MSVNPWSLQYSQLLRGPHEFRCSEPVSQCPDPRDGDLTSLLLDRGLTLTPIYVGLRPSGWVASAIVSISQSSWFLVLSMVASSLRSSPHCVVLLPQVRWVHNDFPHFTTLMPQSTQIPFRYSQSSTATTSFVRSLLPRMAFHLLCSHS